MPFRLKTGLNCVDVRDVALGHLLALTRGISGQRYLIGCQNLWLYEFLSKLEPFTESRVSKITAPDWLALIYATVTDKMPIGRDGNSPGAVEALEAGRCVRFSSSSKAISEIGYRPRGIDLAIREAVEYFKIKGMVM
jgi:dihydroflavonol-4-reductase